MVAGVIQAYLAKRLPPSPAWPFRLPGLAAAALMVECARIDGAFTEVERDAICRAVREELVLDEETARCLVAVAERREDAVWHDWLFTETIKKSFDEYDRLAVIRRLWEVALADGTVHPFEERLIARIARELDISEETVDRQLAVTLRRHTGLTRVADPRCTYGWQLREDGYCGLGSELVFLLPPLLFVHRRRTRAGVHPHS